MRVKARRPGRKSERGVALIIAIFTMMLISVVATALILTAGTATAIKTNYKNSMQAFYDGKAGLEEGRSRLWPGNTNPLNTCVFPAGGGPVSLNQVCYITNPDAAAGETIINPTDGADPYADTEYVNEFGVPPSSANALSVNSNSPLLSPNIPGPLYKWVRITATTEKSSGVHVSGNSTLDNNYPLYYCNGGNPTYCSDGLAHEFLWNGVGLPTNASQVLSVTALAVTPSAGYSGRRLLQYTVTEAPNSNPLGQMVGNAGSGGPPPMTSIVQAALTLDGNGVSYTGSSNNGFAVNGNDSGGSGGVAAIAYTNSSDGASVSSAATPTSDYQSPMGVQSIQGINLPNGMQSPQGLDALVQSITLVANSVITPASGTTADQSNLPSAMSASNPMVVVVNGDFHLTHANGNQVFTGYGLLVVTGDFTYDPDDSWYGMILVIGKGVFTSQGGKNGQINGALLIANTRDRTTGNLLTTLGPASCSLSGGGNGIRYDSSWINQSQALLPMPYQVLSFREIQLTQ